MFIHFYSHLNLRLSSIVVGLQYAIEEVITHRVIWYAAQSTFDFNLVLTIVLALRQIWPEGVDEFVQYCKYCFLNYKTKLQKSLFRNECGVSRSVRQFCLGKQQQRTHSDKKIVIEKNTPLPLKSSGTVCDMNMMY